MIGRLWDYEQTYIVSHLRLTMGISGSLQGGVYVVATIVPEAL